jgi:hypothetical protein
MKKTGRIKDGLINFLEYFGKNYNGKSIPSGKTGGSWPSENHPS